MNAQAQTPTHWTNFSDLTPTLADEIIISDPEGQLEFATWTGDHAVIICDNGTLTFGGDELDLCEWIPAPYGRKVKTEGGVAEAERDVAVYTVTRDIVADHVSQWLGDEEADCSAESYEALVDAACEWLEDYGVGGEDALAATINVALQEHEREREAA